MSTLLVRAHWTDITATAAPLPSSLSGYGTPPTISNPPPSWPANTTGPVPGGTYTVWCLVAAQADLDAAKWGTNTVAPPPPWPSASGAPAGVFDQGYSAAATGFQVMQVRLWQNGSPGTDFVYTITAPNGASVGPFRPHAPGWAPPLPIAVADGKGFWRIDIDRAPGSSVAHPALLLGSAPPRGVHEPYVGPYGVSSEGILGLEFTGTEIIRPVVVSASGSVVIGACNGSGQRAPSSLKIDFSPPLPAGWRYVITWNTGAGPVTTTSGTVGNTPLTATSIQVNYLAGSTYYPSATVTLTPPGGTASSTIVVFTSGSSTSVVVDSCPPPPSTCYDVTVSHTPDQPCVSNGSPVSLTFTADVQPASPPYAGSIVWQVRDSSGQLVPLPSPTATGTTLTMSFTQPGRYQVSASVTNATGCPQPIDTGIDVVDIVSCTCPTILGPIQRNAVDPCTFAFSVQVSNPTGATLTFTWDFGDGTGPHVAGSSVVHTYPSGTQGLKTVTVTVTSPGCSDQATTSAKVDCQKSSPGPTNPGNTGNPGSSGSSSGLCGALIVSAMILGIAACVMGIVAACMAMGPLGIAAAALAVFALALLGLWLALCAAKSCAVYNTIRQIVWTIIVVIAPLVALLLLIFGHLPCAIAAGIILWGYWGTVFAILEWAGPKLPCPLDPLKP